MTLEKFFNKGWFGMVTASLSDASYKGSNKITNTSIFNAGHVVNALGGKEFTWGKKNRTSFGIGSKVTWAGGRRYTPVDTMSSRINGYTVYFDSLTNSKQFRDYFRFDVKLNYKINTKKVTHEIGIDLVNLTGQENILKFVYTNGSSPTREVYQLGFLPIFYYKIDFSLKKRKS